MGFWVTLLTILHILLCIFLIIIVLLQPGRTGGMGAAFGGSSQTIFGAKGAGTFLERLTAISAALFVITSISLAYLSTSRESILKEKAKEREKEIIAREVKPPVKEEETQKQKTQGVSLDGGIKDSDGSVDKENVTDIIAKDITVEPNLEPDHTPVLIEKISNTQLNQNKLIHKEEQVKIKDITLPQKEKGGNQTKFQPTKGLIKTKTYPKAPTQPNVVSPSTPNPINSPY